MPSALCSHTCWEQRFDVEVLIACDFVLVDHIPTNLKKPDCEEYLTFHCSTRQIRMSTFETDLTNYVSIPLIATTQRSATKIREKCNRSATEVQLHAKPFS